VVDCWTSPGSTGVAHAPCHDQSTGRGYSGTLDFGADGNKIFLGLRYNGGDGSTVMLRNLGTVDQWLKIGVSGGTSLQVVDSFGNTQNVPVQDGQALLSVTQMPQYLLLAPGQNVTPPQISLGTNLAPRATFSYSSGSQGNISLLNNGVVEGFQDNALFGGTSGERIWTGDLPVGGDGTIGSQSLEMSFDRPYEIGKLLIRSVRADNQFSSLLDYDLEYLSGGKWLPLESMRTPVPASYWVKSAETLANTWYQDTNFFVHQFEPVVTDKIRLVARRTTFGFAADELAREALRKTWAEAGAPARLMLREIEVYGDFPANTAPVVGNGDGLAATYYDNRDFTGLNVSRVDPQLNFNWRNQPPLSGFGEDFWSARWTGPSAGAIQPDLHLPCTS
jgi:hypothetical protein